MVGAEHMPRLGCAEDVVRIVAAVAAAASVPFSFTSTYALWITAYRSLSE